MLGFKLIRQQEIKNLFRDPYQILQDTRHRIFEFQNWLRFDTPEQIFG